MLSEVGDLSEVFEDDESLLVPLVDTGEPSTENAHDTSDQSSDSLSSSGDSDYQLAADLVLSSLSIPKPRPCFDYVLQPADQLAPKNISSSVDESNILTTKRRAHVALVDDDVDFHIQCFLAGAQFFDQTSEAPKTYLKAMKDPDRDSWTAAIEAELSAMARLGVWEVVDIPHDH
jgi:hypothetical protein